MRKAALKWCYALDTKLAFIPFIPYEPRVMVHVLEQARSLVDVRSPDLCHAMPMSRLSCSSYNTPTSSTPWFLFRFIAPLSFSPLTLSPFFQPARPTSDPFDANIQAAGSPSRCIVVIVIHSARFMIFRSLALDPLRTPLLPIASHALSMRFVSGRCLLCCYRIVRSDACIPFVVPVRDCPAMLGAIAALSMLSHIEQQQC